MMKPIAAALLGLSLLAGTAQAQTVDQRHYDQQRRIEQGERSGALTPREARHAERQQGRIDRTEARMRDRHGGHLTYRDRLRLQHRENRASRHIWRAKHNGRAY